MLGHIRVHYDNVYTTIDHMQKRTTNEGQQDIAAMKQCTSIMQSMGGASNALAIEIADMFSDNLRTIVTATAHYLTAVHLSAQHLQAEERLIASNFNS